MDRRAPAPAQFIAEVSSNHGRDLQRCLEFIRVSADIGCSAVKFQLFKLRQLFAPEILRVRTDLLVRETWELPVEFLPELARACAEKDVQFSCTPFYLKAVEELLPHVAFYKVASYELIWDDLLRECARTGKPVVLSAGMATLEEVRHAVDVLRKSGGKDLTLLHCVSGYPTPPGECNLAVIETLRREFGCPVGWSDHSVNASVVERAVRRWGAGMIEFHLDLDGSGAEFKAGHCWLPGQIAPVIRTVQSASGDVSNDVLPMDGNGKKEPAPSELPDRKWRRDPVDGCRPLRATRTSVLPR